MRRHFNRLLIRVSGWPRRLAALCCLVAAVVSALHRHHSPPPTGIAIVVAARDLPIGTTLGSSDVRLARWPSELAPRRAVVSPAAAVGRRLSTPLARGEPVTLTRVVGRELTAGLSPDVVASTVDTATDLSALVHPGDRVDLIAAPADDLAGAGSGTPASVVARDAAVLAVLTPSERDAGSGSTLIVATSRGSALVLATVSGSRILAVLGRSP